MKLKIKKATNKSHIEILNYLLEVQKYYKSELNIENTEQYSKKIYGNAKVFFVESLNQNIAMCAIYLNFQEDIIYITSFSVTKNYLNKHIGDLLINHILLFAKENSISTVQLEVNNNNHRAISFYEKYNFNIVKNKQKTFLMELKLERIIP